jgi:LuxR family transcriptional regulator, maltose regulon positive regulatory protein
VAAADELAQGSLQAAERYLGLAERGLEGVSGPAPVPAGRRGQALVLLAVVRLLVARQHGNPPAVAEEARRLRVLAETVDATQPGLGEELRALALVSLGITEFWAARFEEAERHLEEGVTLARRIGRPFLEFSGLVYRAGIELFRSFRGAEERSRQAIELAERQGWTDEPVACYAYSILADVPAWQGRPEEAEAWWRRVERTIRPEAEPVAALAVYHVRGRVELARGRDTDALAAFRDAERLAGHLAAQHPLVTATRAWLVHALVRLGETEPAEQVLVG